MSCEIDDAALCLFCRLRTFFYLLLGLLAVFRDDAQRRVSWCARKVILDYFNRNSFLLRYLTFLCLLAFLAGIPASALDLRLYLRETLPVTD